MAGFLALVRTAASVITFIFLSRRMTKPTKWPVHSAKTQISLDIPFFMRTAKTLIRLGGCPCCSESSLGAQVILLVLSCSDSIILFEDQMLDYYHYRRRG